MKIGVIGSGDVGKVLASGFLKHGHEVVIGTRDPAKLADWAKANPKGRVGSFADAAEFGDAVALAVKGAVALEAISAAGARALEARNSVSRYWISSLLSWTWIP